MKRYISCLLLFVLMISLIPLNAFAVEKNEEVIYLKMAAI